MKLTQVAAPTVQPVLRSNTKLYCRVTNTLEDTLFDGLISTARELCERTARIVISPQTLQASYTSPKLRSAAFGLSSRVVDPDGIKNGIELPRTQVTDIVSVKLVATGGPIDVLEIDVDYTYTAETNILHIPDYQGSDKVLVVFTAGYPVIEVEGVNIVDCPDALKQAVYATVDHLYAKRGESNGRLPPIAVQYLRQFARVGGWAG